MAHTGVETETWTCQRLWARCGAAAVALVNRLGGDTVMTGGSEPDDLYGLLDVEPGASAAEITRAYHRRARALHPDAQPGQAGEPAGFQEVEAAYRVLHDPARRAAYDQALRQAAVRRVRKPPAARPVSAPPWPPAARPVWPRSPGRPVAWPPGATVWAGPVQVTSPAASLPASSLPASSLPASSLPASSLPASSLAAVSAWLAALAAEPGSALDWEWPW